VNAIRSVLAEEGSVEHDYLARLAERYSQACELLYKKVYRCRDMLQAGLRKQAVRLAKSTPDLKEEFEALDFVEVPTWLELCEKLNLAIPPILDSAEIGSLIDELYRVEATSSRMEELLRTQRRLALGRAPLADRLRVLRAIYREATEKDFWREDVMAMEDARVQELARLAEELDKKQDRDGLEQILAELRSNEWVTSPPGKFIRGVDAVAAPHRQRQTNDRCAELAEQLRDAHSAMDEARCRKLVAEWKGVCEDTGCEPRAELAEEIAPILSWLDEVGAERRAEAEFQEACMALGVAIDAGADQVALERLAADVLRFERELPNFLAARFASRMEELRQAAKRKFALKLTAVVGGLILLAGIVIASILWYRHTRSVSHWESQIAGTLRQKELDAAGKLLEQCRTEAPIVYASVEIRGLQNRYAQARKAEQDRRRLFKSVLAKIEASGVESPDDRALAEAGSLAKTSDEKRQVWDWKRRIQEHRDKEARKLRQEIESQLAELEGVHQRFREAMQGGQESVIAETGDSVRERARKIRGMEALSPSHLARVEAIEDDVTQRLGNRDEQLKRARGIRAALDRMQSLALRPEELAVSLRGFAAKYPDHEASADFLDAAKMLPYWKSTLAWSEMVRQWRPIAPLADADTAGERLRQLEAYQKTDPNGPHSQAAERYREYLQAVSKSWTIAGLRNYPEAQRLLLGPLLNDLHALRTTKGRTYYLKHKELTPSSIMGETVGYRFKYIIDGTLTEKEGSLKKVEIAEMPKPAPQAAYAAAAWKVVRAFRKDRWETLYLRLAELALKEKSIDPILRANLVKTFLGYAADTTPLARDEVRTASAVLNVDLDLYWMDPDDAASDRQRKQVAALLGKLDSLDGLIKLVDTRVRDLGSEVVAYVPVGIVFGRRGKLSLGNTALGNGSLYVIQAKPKRVVSFVRIGELRSGNATIQPAQAAPCPMGTPVFLRRH